MPSALDDLFRQKFEVLIKIAMAEDNLNTLNKELREINRSIDLQETNMNDDLVSTKQVIQYSILTWGLL